MLVLLNIFSHVWLPSRDVELRVQGFRFRFKVGLLPYVGWNAFAVEGLNGSRRTVAFVHSS